MAGIGAFINRPSFPPLLANLLFEVPQKQQSVVIQGYSPKCTTLMAKAYDKVVQVGVWVPSWFTYSMGRFNILFQLQIYLISLVRTYIFYINHFVVARFYHVCCINCSAVISLLAILVILLQHIFIIFTVLVIILAKPFLLKLSYFFVIICFTFDTN